MGNVNYTDLGFKKYRKTQSQEMRPYVDGEDLTGVSISEEDKLNGSPKDGDMIARNTSNHNDQWLVAAEFFKNNYTLLEE